MNDLNILAIGLTQTIHEDVFEYPNKMNEVIVLNRGNWGVPIRRWYED